MLFLLVGCAGFIVIALIVIITHARSNKPKLPRGWKATASDANIAAKETRADVTRDAFRAKKVPEDVDYILIGSGMGSLYTAGLLARAGKKVVVLEQHYVAGGCTHSFEEKGYEFDTGLHYVGRVEKYKTLFDLVTTNDEDKVEWQKMGTKENDYCYDEIKLGQDPAFQFCAGEDNYIDNLAKEFPSEREAIKEWVRLCQRANKKADMYFYAKLFPKWLQWLINLLLNGKYLKLARQTTAEVVSGLTSNTRLQSLLCATFGNYGLRPEDSSFIIQAGITAHYMGGAYYPIGKQQTVCTNKRNSHV